ncbi:hypothetical protein B566_EDAN010622 [Ephemera danica]|nr:hypothetical protein B566_EDAN010622 [Ephemera danica]
MASKTPLLRAIAQRQYAAGQAATKPFTAQASGEVKTTVLPNKLVVSCVENNSPVSRVSILFRAGPRYETADSLGASHVLRIAAGLGTKGATQFAITRNLQQTGANLSADVGREHIAYTLEATKDTVEESLQYLVDVACKQAFKPWELNDNLPRLRYELAGLSPQAKAVDLLHKVAYRTGLGNSLFCPDHRVGKVSSETMQHFTNQLFRTNRAAVAGVGIDQNILVPLAQNLGIESGAGPDSPKSSFHQGEVRQETSGPIAVVALATESAGLNNSKDALVFALLQRLVGTGPHVKWSAAAAGSPLGKAVSSAVGSEYAAASALNVSYTDSGLFGVVLAAPASVAGKAVESAVRTLRSLSVTDADVQRAKAQLRADALLSVDSGAGLLESIGLESLMHGSVTPLTQLLSQIEGISTSDVSAVARKIASGKPAMASVGNLSSVPYLDQLK